MTCFLVTFLDSDFLFDGYLKLAHLPPLEISVNCSCAGLQLVTQSTHLSKDCWYWTHTVPKFGLQYIQIEGLWSSDDEESKWGEFVLEGLYKNGGVFK